MKMTAKVYLVTFVLSALITCAYYFSTFTKSYTRLVLSPGQVVNVYAVDTQSLAFLYNDRNFIKKIISSPSKQICDKVDVKARNYPNFLNIEISGKDESCIKHTSSLLIDNFMEKTKIDLSNLYPIKNQTNNIIKQPSILYHSDLLPVFKISHAIAILFGSVVIILGLLLFFEKD